MSRRSPVSAPARALARTGVALLLVLSAACSGDDQEERDEPAPAPSARVLEPAPDEDAVREALREAADLRELPPDVQPALGLVARDNSLHQRDQTCVLGYQAVERDEPCLLGDPEGDREVVIWGDVHAAQWIPALDVVGHEEGWRVDVRTKYGCPPLVGTTPWLPAEDRVFVECAEFNARTLAAVTERRPDTVLLAGAVRGTSLLADGAVVPLGRPAPGNGWVLDPEADELWQEGLLRTLEGLEPSGARAVVLGDTPYPGQDAQECLRSRDDVRRCAADRQRSTYRAHARAEARTARRGGATYVETRRWFCVRDTCPAVVDGLVVHRDGFTVGRLYATYLARVLGRAAGLEG